MREEDTFKNSDIAFVATCIILKKAQIVKVTRNPIKPQEKIFHLSPSWESYQTFKQYISDRLQVSPSMLSQKIASIKRLPTEEDQK